MASRLASELRTYFESETDGHLRSIMRYQQDEYELEFVRDDVAERYRKEEIIKAVDESRLDSFTAPIYADTFSDDHGDFVCLAACFEHVVEINFVLGDGEGVAVGLDIDTLGDMSSLIGRAQEIVEDGQ